MAVAFVRHTVADYDKFRAVYDSVEDMQKQGGVLEEAVYRDADSPNEVLVMHRFGSIDQARAFFGNPQLKSAMGQGGVDVSTLRIEFYEEA